MEHSHHGIGMFMTMVCMLIFSQHIPTVCGGTGDGRTVSTVRDGALDGDGILLGTRHGIMVDGILHGMPAIGVATGEVTGVATGDLDGIITILIMDGTDQCTITITPERLIMDFQVEILAIEITNHL